MVKRCYTSVNFALFLKQEARGEEYRENFYLLNLETILCLLIAR